jgi:hypothetical protein
MSIKITNPKISQKLVQELQEHQAYNNIKAYSATYTFLRLIIYLRRDKQFAYIAAKTIKQKFDNYNIKYKQCLNVLVSLDIIEIDKYYIVGKKIRGYRLTEKGALLMVDGEQVYLRSLFTDPKAPRKLQKRASYNKNQSQKYKNNFLQYFHDGRTGYQYNPNAINFIKGSNWPNLTCLDATISLSDFKERKFTMLKFNNTDGRVWNEFVGTARF